MNRAVGVYAFVAENDREQPTVHVAGKGPLEERPVDGTGISVSEEGLVGTLLPDLGLTQLIALNVPGSDYTDRLLGLFQGFAQEAATVTGRSVEMVYFGDNGREHVRWIRP